MNCVRAAIPALLVLAGAVSAEPERTLAELVPAKTVAYLEINALSAAEKERAVAYKCLSEPDLKRVLDRMLSEDGNFSRVAVPLGRATVRIQADMGKSDTFFNIDYRDAKVSRRMRVEGHVALAWVGLDQRIPHGIDAVAMFRVGGLRVGGELPQAYEITRRGMAAIALRTRSRKGGSIDSEMERMLTEYRHADIACTAANFGVVQVHFAVVGKHLVLATSSQRLKNVIDRAKAPQGGAAPAPQPDAAPLSAAEQFTAARRRASGTGTIVLQAHVNIDTAVEALSRAVPHQFSMLKTQLKMVGLGGARAITSITRVDGDGVAGTTSVIVEGRRVGFSRLFEKSEPAKFGCLAFAPKNTLYVSAGSWDVPGMFRLMGEAIGGPMVYTIAQAALQELGADIQLNADLVDLIGPEGAFIVSSNEGLIPDIGVVMESRDAERLERTALKLLALAPWRPGTGVHATKLAGGRAHVVKLFHPRGVELPIAPTFGVVDGHFVAALYPISYQRLVATKRGDREGIAANPDYVSLRKRVPKEALSLSYLDVRRTVGTLYDSMIPLMQAMPQQEGVDPVYEMPDAAIFLRHLYGRVGWKVADDHGMHWHSHSSVDISPALFALGAGVGALIGTTVRAQETRAAHELGGAQAGGLKAVGFPVPSPPRDRLARDRRRCTKNTRDLLNVLRFYQKRNKGFPKNLDKVAMQWVDKKTMHVPGHPGKKYSYYGPGGRGSVLLAGLPNGPDKKICIITTDLEMKRVTPRQLHLLLDHSQKGK
ncbi:MAG: hypothetical protein ACYTGZ_02000 [Planctomycetota bacterium]|jgi:hypothetical protein